MDMAEGRVSERERTAVGHRQFQPCFDALVPITIWLTANVDCCGFGCRGTPPLGYFVTPCVTVHVLVLQSYP
jgi:hypothetical protein